MRGLSGYKTRNGNPRGGLDLPPSGFSFPFRYSLLKIGEKGRSLAGEDGEGGKDIFKIARSQAVGLRYAAVDLPDISPLVFVFGDMNSTICLDWAKERDARSDMRPPGDCNAVHVVEVKIRCHSKPGGEIKRQTVQDRADRLTC